MKSASALNTTRIWTKPQSHSAKTLATLSVTVSVGSTLGGYPVLCKLHEEVAVDLYDIPKGYYGIETVDILYPMLCSCNDCDLLPSMTFLLWPSFFVVKEPTYSQRAFIMWCLNCHPICPLFDLCSGRITQLYIRKDLNRLLYVGETIISIVYVNLG